MIDIIVFVIGLLVSILVVYSVFSQVPLTMGEAKEQPGLGERKLEK